MGYLHGLMSILPPPAWNALSDDCCEAMISFCAEPGDSAPAPGSFQWYEQDSCDELAEEALTWASMEEAVLRRTDEDFSPDARGNATSLLLTGA